MHPAITFLHQLDPSPAATFNIEAYTDAPKGQAKPKPDPLSTRFANLSLEEVSALLPNLERLNSQGAAIYFAVNQCRGDRSKANIERVRGVHADFDGVSATAFDKVRQLLTPTIEVQSSTPDRRHLYWLLEDGEAVAVEAVEQVNRGLVELGADPAAIDASRLLRLPGFRHMKHHGSASSDPEDCHATQVLAVGPRHKWAVIEAALPKEQPRSRNNTAATYSSRIEPADAALVEQAVALMAQAEPMLWFGRWEELKGFRQKLIYPSQSEADMAMASRIAHCLHEIGAAGDNLPALTETVFNRCGLAQRDKWRNRGDYRRATVSRACAAFTSTRGERAEETEAKVDWSLFGDVRNARFFADKWAGQLAYVFDRRRWMRWDTKRWTMCQTGEEVERAKATCQALYQAAGAELAVDPERAQKLAREAAQAHLAQRIKAMVDLAQSDPKLAVSSSRLDADNYLLGVGNGVVDLRSARLLPNQPDELITRHADADFDIGAKCPRWLQFLDEVFDSDQSTIKSVQHLLGYTLTGLTIEEVLIFCVGFGANGKSIFGNVTAAILGDYAKTAPSSMLAARRTDDHGPRADVAMLAGARLVSVNELPAGLQLDEQMVKQIAGREPISARHLYGDFFTYQPRFTCWVRTNHKPIIKGDDDGIWRRIVILPFRRKFSEKERDPGLEGKLMAERDGILRWMVEGAAHYLKHGLYLSPSMQDERKQYRKDSDLLGEFLEERMTATVGARVEQREFYSAWSIWCQQNGTVSGSKKTFTQRLVERGVVANQSNGRRYYVGVSKTPVGLS
jgi:putative DNA primase/helicase